ncbi:MAG: MCP four helix bundle domain-containing protein [Alphaproteobacteria bacterium]|nr:MAG: MCP four helix bundle domain-containing protein [Alphaproteobacteria bacterium]
MLFIRNIRIAPKMLSLIAVLLILTVGISALSIQLMEKMGAESMVIAESSHRTFLAGRGNANILSYARAVEYLPLDMSAEQRDAFEKEADEQTLRYKERIDTLRPILLTEDGKKNLAAADEALAKYKVVHKTVLDLSRQKKFDEAGKAAFDGSPLIATIQKNLREVEERNQKRSTEGSKTLDRIIEEAKRQMWTLTGIGVVLGLGLGLLIAVAGVSRPLGRMVTAMTKVADGDLNTVVPGLGQKDEVGDLASALDKFKAAALENRRLVAEQEEAKKRAAAERKTAMLKMADDFEASVKGVVEQVTSAATKMQSTAQSMSAVSEQTSRQAGAVSASSDQAAHNVESVASAAEELNASIGEISRQVDEAARIARSGVEDADKTNITMQELSSAAEKIGDVVKLIEEIASQVNLLALNATIEAARAGEAGKGFAVVANEVKNLANQTGNATQEITRQISGVQAQTKLAVEAIGTITTTIRRVNEISTAIASAVEEQGAATQEISRNVQQASQSAGEVSRNIGGVTQAATETGSSATEVLHSAGALSSQADALRQVVNGFLGTVRSA